VLLSQHVDASLVDMFAVTTSTTASDNYECADASPLTVNGETVTGSTTEATESESCRAEDKKTAWFLFTGTGNIMTVSTCNAGTEYNSEIQIQSACSDSTCFNNEDTGVALAPCSTPFGKQITFSSIAGTAYYVSVAGVGSASGNYELSLIDHPRPDGDVCPNPASLQVNGEPWLGTTMNATVGVLCTNRFSGPTVGRGVWALVRGTGNIVLFSTCQDRTNFRSTLRVYPGCSSGCDSQVSGTNGVEVPVCTNALGSQILIQTALDALYYVFVSGDGVGDFSLTATDYQRPVNDACGDSLPILVNGDRVFGSTVNSTIGTYCRQRFSSSQARGVWYRTIGTGNVATFSTCHTETSYATTVSVTGGSCTAVGACPANVDTGIAVAPCGNEFGSTITFQTAPDVVYYILVLSSVTANTGNFTLSVRDYARPTNDICPDATPIEVNGAVLYGSTTNSTTDSYCPTRFSASTGRGVWFTAVGNGNIMTFSTCHSETLYDSRLAINSGSCGTGCIADQDPGSVISACTQPLGRQVTIDSVDGTQYYIFVYGASTSVVGNYGLSVIDYVPPANNRCEDAAIVSVDDRPIFATTANATVSTSCSAAAARGAYFRFLGTGNKLIVSTCFAATAFATQIEVREGACSSNCVALATERLCAENAVGQVVSFESTAGREYFLHVYGGSLTNTGDFWLQVRDNTTTLAPTTIRPSLSPVAPTALPTNRPSVATTEEPSGFPSLSVAPSLEPTTAAPSATPTTVTPSSVPSSFPSLSSEPSAFPSHMPSESAVPSTLPTVLPSSDPSTLPSLGPTVESVGTVERTESPVVSKSAVRSGLVTTTACLIVTLAWLNVLSW